VNRAHTHVFTSLASTFECNRFMYTLAALLLHTLKAIPFWHACTATAAMHNCHSVVTGKMYLT
jgi:hypothetical protein